MIDVFETDNYNFIRMILTLTGLWPYSEPKRRTIRTFIIALNSFFIFFLQSLKIIKTNYKIDIIFEMMPYFLITFGSIFMYSNNCVNLTQVYELLEIIKEDWHQHEGTKEFEIMKKYAQESKIYSIIMIAMFYTVSCSLFLASIVPLVLDIINPLNETRQRVLPFLVEFYIDEQKYFITLLTIVLVMFFILGLTAISSCIIFLIFIQHLCGMFYVTGKMVESVFNDKNCSEIITYAKIIRCIKYHKQALQFEIKLRACYRCVYFGLIVIGLFLIATSVIQIIQKYASKLENPIEFSLSIAFFINSTFIIYLKCYFGQKLIDHSGCLLNKIFNTPWYVLNKKSQILLWFMMARSTKPCYLSFGHYFYVSIQFFASMLQTAVSYAMVFCSLH